MNSQQVNPNPNPNRNLSPNSQQRSSASQRQQTQSRTARTVGYGRAGAATRGSTSGVPTGAPAASGTPGTATVSPSVVATAKPKQKHMLRNVIVSVVAVLAAAGIVWGVIVATGISSIFDPSAQEGQAPYKSAEEIQAELDRVVAEGMFNISISSTIDFENSDAEGTAYIENVPGNRYNMRVEIVGDNGEMYYKSGVIKPNQFIEKIKLATHLDKGSYPATAVFHALNPDTNEEEGQASAVVTINVQS